MKLLSILLSLCLTFNVLAASGTISEFERSLDEYQYALTVEWDQKDQVVYERETKAFFKKMNSMMATQGLTEAEILKVLEGKMHDKKALEAIKLKLSLLDKAKTESELAAVLKENADAIYSKGASWNGDVTYYIIGAVAVLAIGYAIWFYSTHECNSYNTSYTCSDTSVAYGTQCYYYEYCEFYKKKGE